MLLEQGRDSGCPKKGKDFSQTVSLRHHLDLSYDGTVVKTPRTSTSKRAEIFSTESSEGDGEQDQELCYWHACEGWYKRSKLTLQKWGAKTSMNFDRGPTDLPQKFSDTKHLVLFTQVVDQ